MMATLNQGMDANGVNDYINIPASADHALNAFTLMAWVKPRNYRLWL
ncbi:MAG: hypothetical protein R2795_18490 [Saprospiraceae bacterium]